MAWMFVKPQNSYVGILMPNVMVCEDGAFGRWLGHESRALMNEINGLFFLDLFILVGGQLLYNHM